MSEKFEVPKAAHDDENLDRLEGSTKVAVLKYEEIEAVNIENPTPEQREQFWKLKAEFKKTTAEPDFDLAMFEAAIKPQEVVAEYRSFPEVNSLQYEEYLKAANYNYRPQPGDRTTVGQEQ